MPEFKYIDLINEVKEMGCNCPPETLLDFDSSLNTYRYIFEGNPKKNHLPNRKTSPRRVLAETQYCSTCGLSCFNTLENALNNFDELIKSIPLIYKSIGDSLALGTLNMGDGQMTEIDNTGHFDLFEYSDFNPHVCFNFVKRLI